jgi:hypothetical protein
VLWLGGAVLIVWVWWWPTMLDWIRRVTSRRPNIKIRIVSVIEFTGDAPFQLLIHAVVRNIGAITNLHNWRVVARKSENEYELNSVTLSPKIPGERLVIPAQDANVELDEDRELQRATMTTPVYRGRIIEGWIAGKAGGQSQLDPSLLGAGNTTLSLRCEDGFGRTWESASPGKPISPSEKYGRILGMAISRPPAVDADTKGPKEGKPGA